MATPTFDFIASAEATTNVTSLSITGLSAYNNYQDLTVFLHVVAASQASVNLRLDAISSGYEKGLYYANNFGEGGVSGGTDTSIQLTTQSSTRPTNFGSADPQTYVAVLNFPFAYDSGKVAMLYGVGGTGTGLEFGTYFNDESGVRQIDTIELLFGTFSAGTRMSIYGTVGA